MIYQSSTMKQIKQFGFTLVEILVVISIIGLLASLTLVSFTGTQKSARDTQRKSDLKQYATTLETFANENNSLYPEHSTTVSAKDILCDDLGITTCPEDPKNSADPAYSYNYQSDGTASTGDPAATKFILWAKVEKTTDYWVVCSNGQIGTKAQAGGMPSSGGSCPI